MNLFDMLSQAQGGNGIEALSRQFNLSQQQTQSAVEALLPAFSQAFRQNSADPYGLGSLLTALGSGRHAQYAEDATKAFSPQGMAEGKGILDHLFGSKDLSRAVAAQASQATGIGQETLKQMLPAIATMLMGSLFKQTNNKVQAGAFGAANPLGQIIEQMMKGQGGASKAPQHSNNPLGDILGQILGGAQGGGQGGQVPQGNNPLGDILGQILGGGQGGQTPSPRQRAPQSGSDNPLGDILGQILGGSGAQGAPDVEPEEEQRVPPQRRTQRSAPQQAPSNPLEDIFGKMFNPGGQGGTAQTSSTSRASTIFSSSSAAASIAIGELIGLRNQRRLLMQLVAKHVAPTRRVFCVMAGPVTQIAWHPPRTEQPALSRRSSTRPQARRATDRRGPVRRMAGATATDRRQQCHPARGRDTRTRTRPAC